MVLDTLVWGTGKTEFRAYSFAIIFNKIVLLTNNYRRIERGSLLKIYTQSSITYRAVKDLSSPVRQTQKWQNLATGDFLQSNLESHT